MSTEIEKLEALINDNGYDGMKPEIEKLATSRVSERCELAAMLGDYANSHSEKILIGLLSDNNVKVRIEAAQSLCAFRSPEAYEALNVCLKREKNVLQKGYVISGIGYNCPDDKKADTQKLLFSILDNEKNNYLRIKIFCALYIWGDQGAISEIMNLYNRCGSSNKCTILNDLADMLERNVGDAEDIKAFACVAVRNLPGFNVRGAFERLRVNVDRFLG